MNRTMPLGQAELRMSEVISALSYALDITEGQPPGHAVRSCLIGMRLADELGLGAQERSDLYYALLLDKPGLLTEAERIEIERHPVHTRELLGRVTAFRELADDASDHLRGHDRSTTVSRADADGTRALNARCRRGHQARSRLRSRAPFLGRARGGGLALHLDG